MLAECFVRKCKRTKKKKKRFSRVKNLGNKKAMSSLLKNDFIFINITRERETKNVLKLCAGEHFGKFIGLKKWEMYPE